MPLSETANNTLKPQMELTTLSQQSEKSLRPMTFQKVRDFMDIPVFDLTSDISIKLNKDRYDAWVAIAREDGTAFYINFERLSKLIRAHLFSILPQPHTLLCTTTSLLCVGGQTIGFARHTKAPSLKCTADDRCSGEAVYRCTGCNKVRYCSMECQLSDWPQHYIVCDAGWINSLRPFSAEVEDSQRSSYFLPSPTITEKMSTFRIT